MLVAFDVLVFNSKDVCLNILQSQPLFFHMDTSIVFLFLILIIFPNDAKFEMILREWLILLSLETKTYFVPCSLINQASKYFLI